MAGGDVVRRGSCNGGVPQSPAVSGVYFWGVVVLRRPSLIYIRDRQIQLRRRMRI